MLMIIYYHFYAVKMIYKFSCFCKFPQIFIDKTENKCAFFNDIHYR